MKRQVAKGLTMFMLLVGLAFASAAVANGQSGNHLTADVPFDFVVADKTLRSGQYEVYSAVGSRDVIAIRSSAGNQSALRITSATLAKARQDMKAKLVFHRYGSTYFLSQVWMAGNGTGRQLARTQQERARERELKVIAAYHGENKPVYEIIEVIASVR